MVKLGGDEQETHERLMLSFRAVGVGMWDYDIDEDILWCSRRWYEIVGVDPETNPIVTIDQFKPYIHPDDAEQATQIDLEQVTQWLAADEHYHAEFRIVRSDGDLRWVRSVACLIVDERTGRRRAVGCIADMTEMRTPNPPEHAGGQPPARALSADTGRLTAKELECLAWVSMGKTAWETARIFGLSARTIEFHLANATAKLGASNKIHAAALAIRAGII